MQRFTGWLLLIVVLCGLGVLMYQDMRLRNERTELPSAITAGSPEGPGDEPAPITPMRESVAPTSAEGGTGAAAESPGAVEPPARAVASAEPPPAVETRAAADAPSPSADAAPSMQPSGGSAETGPSASTAAESAASAATGRPAETPISPAEPPATVVADSAGTPTPAAEPAAEPAPDAAAIVSEPASPAAPEAATSEVADASLPKPVAEPAPYAAAVVSEPASPAPPESTTSEITVAPLPGATPDGIAAGDDNAPPVEPAPVEAALEPPAASPNVDGATEVAVAPEIETQTQPGTTPPESESSGRDSMMQAAPDPETAPLAAAETVVAAIDPSADAETPQPTAVPDSIAPGTDSQTASAPTFDVVRIESTGDAVVAGRASPGATVELIAGATTLATTIASEAGDWAIALDQPLPAGPHDLGLRATSKDTGVVTESEQRVAVLVPETVADEPLVVLNAPNAASTILQVPAAPEPGAADVAALDSPDIAATAPEGEGTPTPAAPTTAAAGASAPFAPAETDAAGSAGPPVEPDVAVATPLAEPPAASPTAAPADASAPAAAADAEVAATPAAEPAETPLAPMAQEPAASGTEPEQEVAVAEPEPQPDPEPVVESVVAVTAVEAESSGALFVAGTATTPEDVRVYVDDVLLGEATPSPSGTWLIEVNRELPAGTYRVRADQVEPGAATVLARAEVPFEREVEVAILRPVAETGGGAGAEATGTMAGPTTLIIKRSDNLWRISRQLYGKGIRWSTIYEANKDQIRNPRFIYPGQVFILPEGNAAWAENGGGAAQ